MTDSLEEQRQTDPLALDQEQALELRQQYEEPEGDYDQPMETFVTPVEKRWPEAAASERAAYITMARGGDHAFYREMMQELIQQGESPEDDMTQAEINKQDIESRIETAAGLMPDLAPEEGKAVINSIQDDINQGKDLDVADEITVRLSDNPFLRALSEDGLINLEKKQDSLRDRLEYNRKIEGIKQEMHDLGFKFTAGAALDLLGSFTTLNDMTSYHKLLDYFKIDFNVGQQLAPGELLHKMRKHVSKFSSKERYQLALVMQEFLLSDEGAGIVDSNAIQAANMMAQIFDPIEADPTSFDWERWIMNVGPLIDMFSMGLFRYIGKAVAASFRYQKLSRSNRLIAADPDTGAELAKKGAVDPDTAEMLGETPQSIIVKSTAPKPEGLNGPLVPAKVTDDVIEAVDERAILDQINESTKVVLSARGKASLAAVQEDIENLTSSHKLWSGSTEVSGEIGKPWKVTAIIGKNERTGFIDRDEARKILDDVYNGQGRIVSRTNTIDGVEEVIEKGQEFTTAVAQVRRELEATKNVKLSRGDEKKLRAELRQLQIEKARKQETIKPVTLGGTKAQRQEAVTQNQVIQRDIEPLQREIDEIQGLLDSNATSAKAEDDISRLLNVKKTEDLDGLAIEKSTRDRIVELTSDNMVQAAKPKEEAVDYFIQVERKGDLKFADDDVKISLFGERGSWIFDSDSLLAKGISQVANMMFDRWKGIEKEMLRFLDPIAELSRKDQIIVSKILAKGNEKSKNYSPTAIRRMVKEQYGDISTIDRKVNGIQNAYSQFRKAMDIMFTIENRNFRQMLIKKDMKHIQSGDYNTFAKPLSRDEALDIKQAFNPVTGKIEPVKAETLYGSGQQLGKLRKTEIDGDQGTNYILLKDSDINELPQMVLNKRPGYLPLTNESNYFLVRKTPVTIDGVEQKRHSTVGVGSSLNDIETAKKNANLKLDGSDYEWKHDRELTYDQFVDSSLDLYQHTGGLFYSKRGDRLQTTANVDSKVRDPLAAGVSGISRVSRDATMTQYIRDMKARFLETYGDLLPNKGEFPSDVSYINKPGRVGDPEVAKARTMYRSIQMFDGYGQYSSFRKNAIVLADIAERNLGKPGAGLAKLIRSQADSNPIAFIRGKNFEFQIATNPIAQFFLQPTQAINTLALGGNARDFQRGWTITKLARQRADVLLSDEELAGKARLLGTTVDELRQDIKGFRHSGMGAAVTSHETARDAVPGLSRVIDQGAAARVASAASENLYTKPVGLLRKGFERGEEWNLGVHWITAKKRWMKNNEGKSPYTPEAQAAIQGEARSLAVSMIRTGDFAYQRGLLALPTQYLAVTHKQLLLMLPQQLGGSKAITNREKLKVALWQLGLWGPTGLGLGGIVTHVANKNEVNLSEGALEIINDGVAESVINGGLNMIFDGETDLDIAGRYAPGGGINDNLFTVLMEALVNNEIKDLGKMAFGPTASSFNRFSEVFDAAHIVLNTDGVNSEDIQNLGDRFLSVLSSYNNINKSLVYSNLNYVTDKNGVKIYEPSTAELIGRSVLGIQSNKADAYYATKLSKRKYDEYIDGIATEYHQHVMNVVGNAIDSYTGDYALMKVYLSEQMRLHNAVINIHGEDAPAIMEALSRKIKNLEKDGKDNLIRQIHKLITINPRGSSADDVFNTLINSGLVPEGDIDKVRNMVNELYGVDNADDN